MNSTPVTTTATTTTTTNTSNTSVSIASTTTDSTTSTTSTTSVAPIPRKLTHEEFLPIFMTSITAKQRIDYEFAQKHFGVLYRIQDTNYFQKKYKEFIEKR